MDMEFLNGQMAENTVAIGLKINNMVQAHTLDQTKTNQGVVSGRTED